MFFRTGAECDERAKLLGFAADPQTNRIIKINAPLRRVRVSIAKLKISAAYPLSLRIDSWFGPTSHCLLWITEFGVWRSSENVHLYYKLRNSYDDFRALHEAPGHEFESYEEKDLATFIYVMINFGWGGFLFGTPNATHITFSHDEWVLIETSSDINHVIEDIKKFDLPYEEAHQSGKNLN